MKKIILTGATGFIGNAVLRELIKHDIQVIAISRSKEPENIPDSPLVHYISCELADMKEMLLSSDIKDVDTFYHFGWMGTAGSMRADTKLQLDNAQWTVEALESAHALGCKRFVCAGSIMEHETMAAAYTQGNRPGLGYIYGGGKVIAHIMCMSVAAKLGIDLIWPAITNAYGEGEVSPRLVNTTIRKCIHGEAPQFTAGTQNYDFVYIDDVARAFYLIGEKGKPFHEYLIGSGQAKALKEFLLEMQAAIAPNLDFVFGDIPFTGIDLPLERFDCTETEKDTGFKAEISFAEGTRRTKAWLEQWEGDTK